MRSTSLLLFVSVAVVVFCRGSFVCCWGSYVCCCCSFVCLLLGFVCLLLLFVRLFVVVVECSSENLCTRFFYFSFEKTQKYVFSHLKFQICVQAFKT